MAELRSKGTGVASLIAVMKERLTAAQLQQVEAALPPETLALWRRRILAVEWIPFSVQMPIGKAVVAVTGGEQPLLDMIHEAAGRDLAGVYKLLIRVMSPEGVAARAGKIFGTYVESGEMTVTPIDRVGGRARFSVDVSRYPADPHAWLTLRGYIEAPMLRTGAKNLRVALESHEIVSGDAKLRYRVEYDT